MNLAEHRILVTGGAGFLGSHVVERLARDGCRHLFVPRAKQFDLRDREAIFRLLAQTGPSIVLHLAGVVGGIGVNRKHPGRFFYDNAIMGIQLMECARLFGVEKFVNVGTICSYPKFGDVPFRESQLWDGYPEETNASYGLAKKMLLVQGQAYRSEYGFNSIYLLPVNLYGPRENFNLETSHVIPAIVRKCLEAVEARKEAIVLWGDGLVTREFLYVEDAARAIVLATRLYHDAEPVNVGVGREISIRRLAEIIAEEAGFSGRILWDPTQPSGQPRRAVDTRRAEQAFGFTANVGLREGIRRTLDWYKANREVSGREASPRADIFPANYLH